MPLFHTIVFAATAARIIPGLASQPINAGLDHGDFGSVRSEVLNVIGSFTLERDAGGKPIPTFPHPAPESGAARA